MTRAVWLKADDTVGDWNARRRRITAGLEAGVDWVLVDEADVGRVRELGAVNVAAFSSNSIDVIDSETDDPDATIVGKGSEGDGSADLPQNASGTADFSGSSDISALRSGEAEGAYVRIFDADYEELAEEAAREGEHTIVVGEDWSIIPLENLISRIGEETELIAGVTSAAEARTAFETLEIGADSVLLDSDDPDTIREVVAVRDEADREELDLQWAEVTSVEQVGSADRVCVDTASLLEDDEGMLVGSMSRGLFFVHAETAQSPYVASRPFRVNAGAVHAYVRTPDGGTRYLSEFKSGDEVQVIDREGHTREALVGRTKTENRPMFRLEADVNLGGEEAEIDDAEDTNEDDANENDDPKADGSASGTDRIETLLQNAETIKIPTREGRKAITDIEVGDRVLVYYENAARHFGERVEESIIEK